MILLVAFLAAAFWGMFIIFVFYLNQRPESQVRRRIEVLIENAENERAKHAAKEKKIARQEALAKSDTVIKNIFYLKYISPILNVVDKQIQSYVPVQIKNLLEEKIFQAGKTGVWGLPRLVTFWVISLISGTALAIAITSVVEYHFLQETMIVLAGVAWGAFFPVARLNKMIADRKKVIKRALPEFLDLLCVSVQAGLSFDAAVSKITVRMKGPLVDEFKRFQNDVSLGMTKQYALNQMAQRCDLEELYLFTTSVIQSEKLGTSMGRTLKIQADNMRDRHKQFIKSEAMKAPVKIIFPMVLFIFPSVFVVVLFPAFLSFVKNLGK